MALMGINNSMAICLYFKIFRVIKMTIILF